MPTSFTEILSQWRYPTAFSDNGTLCRRGGIFSCTYGLHHDGREYFIHVCYRSNVVKTVTHEEVTAEELGGATTHSTKSGVAHFTYANEIELINNLKRLLSHMPQIVRKSLLL